MCGQRTRSDEVFVSNFDFPWALIYPFLSYNKTICRGILGPVVATQGSGPYTESAFDQFLIDCGIEIRTIAGDEPPGVVVLGHDDWDEGDIGELAENCFTDIRVYSQEMVLASMAIGTDIFDFDTEGETIFDFIDGHAALERFHRDGVQVPGLAERADGGIPIDTIDEPVETLHVEYDADSVRPAVGILGDMGYRVGKTRGLPRHQRQQILWRTFRVHLTATSPWTQEYINEWGQRCSPARFNKICSVLYGLIKGAERRTTLDMSEAIRDWEQDLEFVLHNKTDWLTHTH